MVSSVTERQPSNEVMEYEPERPFAGSGSACAENARTCSLASSTPTSATSRGACRCGFSRTSCAPWQPSTSVPAQSLGAGRDRGQLWPVAGRLVGGDWGSSARCLVRLLDELEKRGSSSGARPSPLDRRSHAPRPYARRRKKETEAHEGAGGTRVQSRSAWAPPSARRCWDCCATSPRQLGSHRATGVRHGPLRPREDAAADAVGERDTGGSSRLQLSSRTAQRGW